MPADHTEPDLLHPPLAGDRTAALNRREAVDRVDHILMEKGLSIGGRVLALSANAAGNRC